jgi:hypothetical protein
MSGTVNYPKVIDQLTDVIKELNVPCAEAAPAAPSEETRRADAVDLLKTLLSELENAGEAGAAAAAAAAEHGAAAQKKKVGSAPMVLVPLKFQVGSSVKMYNDFNTVYKVIWTPGGPTTNPAYMIQKYFSGRSGATTGPLIHAKQDDLKPA